MNVAQDLSVGTNTGQVKYRLTLSDVSQFGQARGYRQPPGWLIHDSIEAGCCSCQARVCPQTPQQRQGHPRHLRIKLPWMEIQHRRSAPALGLGQSAVHECQWQETKIATSSDGQMLAEHPPHQGRHFQEGRPVEMVANHEGTQRGRWDAVPGMAHGKDRCIVFKPRFDQDVDCPGRLGYEAEGGSSVTDDSAARLVFNKLLALGQILAKGLRFQTVQAIVSRAVTGNLMTGLGNTLGQLRLTSGDMAKNEKRASLAVALEMFEQQIHISLDPRRPVVPLITLDMPLGRFNVEIFLNIDRHTAQRCCTLSTIPAGLSVGSVR